MKTNPFIYTLKIWGIAYLIPTIFLLILYLFSENDSDKDLFFIISIIALASSLPSLFLLFIPAFYIVQEKLTIVSPKFDFGLSATILIYVPIFGFSIFNQFILLFALMATPYWLIALIAINFIELKTNKTNN